MKPLIAKMMMRLLLAGMAVAGIYLAGCKERSDYQEGNYEPPALAYQGETTGLERTMIVPTLDSPAEKGKNVIWCGSFQMAWDQMVKEVIRGPIQLSAAQEVASRLNQNRMDETDLIPGGYYAAAGKAEDGIIKKIHTDMAAKFPDVELPPLPGDPGDLVAYAYLTAAVKFTTSYFDHEGSFTDGENRKTLVSGFGLFQGHNSVNDKLAEQIEILYTLKNMNNDSEPLSEFALDLCRTSSPCQIIVACIPRQDSLQQTINSLWDKIKNWNGTDYERKFDSIDTLFVPDVNYKLTHHFWEIIGNHILNQKCEEIFIAEALQRIQFRLDKSGALVVSDAVITACEAIPRIYIFDKPFLIIMRKRGAEKPFFVMWVDNAELLCKSGPAAAGEK